MRVEFKAMDYTSDDNFQESNYIFEGAEESGWNIYRNGDIYLQLEPGYKILKTKLCGVCSTDIDRRFLPFPLPQVIGHEVIGQDPTTGKSYVVEINDTMEARGSKNSDAFIRSGIPTHSPERQVLGIDRLPGGFGPYMLAPKNAIISYEGIPDRVAVMIEPFAAAVQAILASPPMEGDSVAVLGPRRLGSLILSALNAYRKSSGKNFHITALTRREELSKLSLKLGADSAINLKELRDKESSLDSLSQKFSIVYDTTATEEGFLTALELAEREVHLKTTNGQVMGGLAHLTEMVVDELSILPFSNENLNFHWEREPRQNKKVYVAPSLLQDPDSYEELRSLMKKSGVSAIDSMNPDLALLNLEYQNDLNLLPRYDIAIAGSLNEIAKCIRPILGREESLVRPRGAILYIPSSENEGPLEDFFRRGGSIRSSRCGDFHYAIQLLKENPEVVTSLDKNMISHEYPSHQLNDAYRMAQTPQAVKVLVVHDP